MAGMHEGARVRRRRGERAVKFTASHTVDTPRSNNDNTYDVYLDSSLCYMRVNSMVETSTSALARAL